MHRIKVIFTFLERKLEGNTENIEDYGKVLKTLELLPALRRPSYFPIPWPSDHLEEGVLFCAHDIFPSASRDLVCLVSNVLDDVVMPRISDNVREFLELNAQEPELSTVLLQLERLTDEADDPPEGLAEAALVAQRPHALPLLVRERPHRDLTQQNLNTGR